MPTTLSLVVFVLAIAGIAVMSAVLALKIAGIVRYIPNNRAGIVERIWSRRGSIAHGFIALAGEAGYLPELLRGGVHVMAPFTYRVHRIPLVTIGQGKIGYVFARDGEALTPVQTLARTPAIPGIFEDVRTFLGNGGQRGPQRGILREGTYAINLAQFVVLTEEQTYARQLSDSETQTINDMRQQIIDRDGFLPVRIADGKDQLGVVTVHDGVPLLSGTFIAPRVDGHSNYQDPEAFLAAGGRRGRQLQEIVEGTYYINRLFATVALIDKTIIDIGYVGVVVSYTGNAGTDTSGDDYRHGELVETNHRGVWNEPLLPGKYAFNRFAGNIMTVPTTNLLLKWQSDIAGTHKLDENLSEISLITRDAFEPDLPLSIVFHIDYQQAPKVVQRFGDVRRLIEQTLDPMVSAYFKDIAQKKTLIELLQERAEIQQEATTAMRERFSLYSLELQEVLIGTPRAPAGDETIETILVQLRQRQIATEQVATYQLQGEAAIEERKLNDTRALAAMQTAVTQSQMQVTVRENEGAAALAMAHKDAERVQVIAAADAAKLRLEGEGKASAIVSVGIAQADATKKQVDAYGGPQFRLAEQIADKLFAAIAQGGQPLVPQMVVGDSNAASPAALLSSVMAGMLPKLVDALPPAPTLQG